LLAHIPGSQLLYGSGWDAAHPFDRIHGTDTSGFVSSDHLPVGEPARAHAICYAGSQPSVLRTALKALPPLGLCTFVDLGCGKGRPLLVASEFPFRDILGVELSPSLAEIARRNAAAIAQRFPQRTAIRVVVADASEFPLPAGDLVVFLYHPFGAELVAKVVAAVEAAVMTGHRAIYVVYYNPVAGHCFDSSPLLTRRFARMIPYAKDEISYGPDEFEPLIIWQGGSAPPPIEAAIGKIVPVKSGIRVIIEDS
jgi:SAM-dependent methyltransferase